MKSRRNETEVQFESRRNGSRRNGSRRNGTNHRRNGSRRNGSRRNGSEPSIIAAFTIISIVAAFAYIFNIAALHYCVLYPTEICPDSHMSRKYVTIQKSIYSRYISSVI